MTIIIGGRQSILSQVPKEVRKLFPRLDKPLTSDEARLMLEQSILALQDEKLAGSHVLFCDVIRLILSLQLSVSETNFK